MNAQWQQFLSSQQARFNTATQIVFSAHLKTSEQRLIPIAELAVLTVSGTDAASLLQGQITCNVNELNETHSSLAAMCNPKGRVISTLLLIKTPCAYLLVLPLELLAIVQKRLQVYILRSKVTVTDSSNDYCLLGLVPATPVSEPLFATCQTTGIRINFGQRCLIIASVADAIECWQQQLQFRFTPDDSEQWAYLDMLDGIPWLSVNSSEEHLPQMLNLDKLGGISFTKGCYTGQEVVARTHYLGKAKRALFLLESAAVVSAAANDIIVDDSTGAAQIIGTVLSAKHNQLLAVLQLPLTLTPNLFLKNQPDNKLTLLPL